MINHFNYLSADGVTNIHAVEWSCESPRAILQIAHGMVEYVMRYSQFAAYLASQGITVVGNDHLGHGQSVVSQDKLGYFADSDGNQKVLEDMHRLRLITSEKYPNVPYFIMGHSMGSFLTRQYIQRSAEGLSGAIIMGSGHQPNATLTIAMGLCKMIAAFKGWSHRSKFIDNLAFGAYNKSFEPSRTSKDWLTSDIAEVDAYVADPLCSVLFTVNGYYNMFSSIKNCSSNKNIAKIPHDLAVLLISGDRDPVGGCGKGVAKVKDGFVKAGMLDVNQKLYTGGRHEILNDTMRQEVYDDILQWLLSVVEV